MYDDSTELVKLITRIPTIAAIINKLAFFDTDVIFNYRHGDYEITVEPRGVSAFLGGQVIFKSLMHDGLPHIYWSSDADRLLDRLRAEQVLDTLADL